MLYSRPLMTRRMGRGQGKRHESPPLVQAGGVQPYSQFGGQMPGPALQAMQGGATLFGANPMDVQRRSQVQARSLLDSLRR